jgi:hypothetical protein
VVFRSVPAQPDRCRVIEACLAGLALLLSVAAIAQVLGSVIAGYVDHAALQIVGAVANLPV